MHHIITTRLGLGIARPSFYDQHIALLKTGLLKSMATQTCQNFEWYIVVDQQIPKSAQAALQKLLAPYPHFKLIKHDPIATGSLTPTYSQLPQTPAADPLVISRIDDDDLLHKNTIQLLQSYIADTYKQEPVFSVSCGDGIYAYVEQNYYAKRHYPKVSVCMTLVCTHDNPMDIYGINHAKIDTKMQELGKQHHVIRTTTPAWVYAQRTTSESFASKTHNTKIPPITPDALKTILTECGVAPNWGSATCDITTKHPDYAPVLITNDKNIKRMRLKKALLKSITNTKDKETSAYTALINGFYAL